MIKILNENLLRTGINFSFYEKDTLDDRFILIARDTEIPQGDGYELVFSAGDARGFLDLKFDTYASRLLTEFKTLLTSNLELIIHFANRTNSNFFIRIDSQTYKAEDVDSQLFSTGLEVSLRFETKMFDLRKTNEFNNMIGIIGEFSEILVLQCLPYSADILGEIEGMQEAILSTKYERSRKNRTLCLLYNGHKCSTCDISFEEKYGPLAKNFIHVHHLEPISQSGIKTIDPTKDLIPLCPNCHAVAHLKTPPYLPTEIKQMIQSQEKE